LTELAKKVKSCQYFLFSSIIKISFTNSTNLSLGENAIQSGPNTETPMRDSPYDDLNQKIVRMLQTDGRLPYKDIAKALQVSEGTIRNRVQRMKDAGLLKIVALVDPMAIKYQADAMLGINVASPHTPQEVAERLSKCNEVVYVLWVSGRFDLMVEVVCESTNRFRAFLEDHCYRSPDLHQVEIMTGIDMFKNQFLLKRQAL